MQAKARHRVDILMQQAAFQQLAHQHRHAARGLEVVDVRRTVRVQTRHQRYHGGDIGEVIPVNQNARRARHRDKVHGMVG